MNQMLNFSPSSGAYNFGTGEGDGNEKGNFHSEVRQFLKGERGINVNFANFLERKGRKKGRGGAAK